MGSVSDSEMALDPEALERIREIGGDHLLKEVFELFVETAPHHILAAREAEQRGDLQALQESAHALRSSAVNIGASLLSELCAQIEHLAAEETPESFALLSDLETEFEEVQVRLESEMARLN